MFCTLGVRENKIDIRDLFFGRVANERNDIASESGAAGKHRALFWPNYLTKKFHAFVLFARWPDPGFSWPAIQRSRTLRRAHSTEPSRNTGRCEVSAK